MYDEVNICHGPVAGEIVVATAVKSTDQLKLQVCHTCALVRQQPLLHHARQEQQARWVRAASSDLLPIRSFLLVHLLVIRHRN